MSVRAELDGLHDLDGSMVQWADVVFLNLVVRSSADRFFWEPLGWWQFQTLTDRWIWLPYRGWSTPSLVLTLKTVLPGFAFTQICVPRSSPEGSVLEIWHRSDLRCPQCRSQLVEREDPEQQRVWICPRDGYQLRLGRRLVIGAVTARG